jgi:hypothetical protein
LDDTVKKIAQSIAVGAVKKGLIAVGALLAGHGLALGFTPTDYAAAAVGIVAAAWSFWGDWGKPIVLAQLDVLKARSLAAAAKIHAAGLPAVTPAEIAAQSPTLTAASVVKIAATMAPTVQASVVPESTKPTVIKAAS